MDGYHQKLLRKSLTKSSDTTFIRIHVRLVSKQKRNARIHHQISKKNCKNCWDAERLSRKFFFFKCCTASLDNCNHLIYFSDSSFCCLPFSLVNFPEPTQCDHISCKYWNHTVHPLVPTLQRFVFLYTNFFLFWPIDNSIDRFYF